MTDFEQLSLEVNELREHIKKQGAKFSGRYLLTRRQMREKSPAWHACQSLVEEGEAEWLGWNSSYAPGIQLKRWE